MAHILIIEDDSQLQKIYQTKLQKEGFKVSVIGNGHQVIPKVNEIMPDLIILDIILPGGVNGFDILENLKRNPKFTSIPVIILTNLDSERETALKIGADDYMIKSNSQLEQIIIRIYELLTKKRI